MKPWEPCVGDGCASGSRPTAGRPSCIIPKPRSSRSAVSWREGASGRSSATSAETTSRSSASSRTIEKGCPPIATSHVPSRNSKGASRGSPKSDQPGAAFGGLRLRPLPPQPRLTPPLPLARLRAAPTYRPLDRRRGAGEPDRRAQRAFAARPCRAPPWLRFPLRFPSAPNPRPRPVRAPVPATPPGFRTEFSENIPLIIKIYLAYNSVRFWGGPAQGRGRGLGAGGAGFPKRGPFASHGRGRGAAGG